MGNWSFFKVQPKPVIIAHRGASGYTCENTLIAFKMALDMGCRFIELDVHQTKDGHVVISHNDKIRIKKLGLRSIGSLTLEDIKGSAVVSSLKSDEEIPTLGEALNLIARRAVVNVEIKGQGINYPGIEEKVADLLEKKGYGGMSYISSFNYSALKRLREVSPDAYIGYVVSSVSKPQVLWEDAKKINCGALIVSRRIINKSFVKAAHDRNFHVCTYTINKRSEFDEVKKMGVDAVFTDYPDIKGIPEFEAHTVGLTSGD
ncbi:glycerophosphodiester phosphodiesterase [Elusimicrobiota bacterium]